MTKNSKEQCNCDKCDYHKEINSAAKQMDSFLKSKPDYDALNHVINILNNENEKL